MLFCPKCGSIMKPIEEDGKKVMSCSCGYKNKNTKNVNLKEQMVKTKELEVVSEDQELDTLPVTEAECPKCKHDKCYYWLVQTRAADEPETKFLKCCKCLHTFRDYN